TRIPIVHEQPSAGGGYRGDLDSARVVRGGRRKTSRGGAGAVCESGTSRAGRDRAALSAGAWAGDRRRMLRGGGAGGRRAARRDTEPDVGRGRERDRANAGSAAGGADQ